LFGPEESLFGAEKPLFAGTETMFAVPETLFGMGDHRVLSEGKLVRRDGNLVMNLRKTRWENGMWNHEGHGGDEEGVVQWSDGVME
jgi:hypothetical protein